MWDRFEFGNTPKHGNWLNMAEIELNVMVGQCLNRRIESIAIMTREVAAWQARRDKEKAKLNWQFKTADARIKLKVFTRLSWPHSHNWGYGVYWRPQPRHLAVAWSHLKPQLR